MPMNLTRKIISAHLTKPSDMNPGDEIYVKFDQTLTHDINAVMCYLALEGMGIKRVRTDVSVSYLDHNLLYVNTNTPDDHIFLTSIARKYGIWLSRPGNGICHQVQLERFGKLSTQYEEAETLLLMIEEENDPSLAAEGEEAVNGVEKSIDELQLMTMLNGEYDLSLIHI